MPKTWYQEALFESDVLELNVRIGVIRVADHLQAYVELKDPTDNRLIDAKSLPHRSVSALWETITEVHDVAQRMLEAALEPF